MVGIMQRLVARYSVSIMQVDEKLAVIEEQLKQKNNKCFRSIKQNDDGAVTAEYAVVIIAATGFAALLVAILKSDDIRKALTELVKKAMKMS